MRARRSALACPDTSSSSLYRLAGVDVEELVAEGVFSSRGSLDLSSVETQR